MFNSHAFLSTPYSLNLISYFHLSPNCIWSILVLLTTFFRNSWSSNSCSTAWTSSTVFSGKAAPSGSVGVEYVLSCCLRRVCNILPCTFCVSFISSSIVRTLTIKPSCLTCDVSTRGVSLDVCSGVRSGVMGEGLVSSLCVRAERSFLGGWGGGLKTSLVCSLVSSSDSELDSLLFLLLHRKVSQPWHLKAVLRIHNLLWFIKLVYLNSLNPDHQLTTMPVTKQSIICAQLHC